MDDLPDQFPADSLERGTHLLGVSLPMQGLARITDLYVAYGLDAGETCFVVTTDRDARAVLDSIRDLVDDPPLDRLAIVDSTGQQFDSALPCHLETVGSPGDLTGLGIGLAKSRDALQPEEGELRVVIDSVSSLLVHAGFDRVYRFLHMVINRVGGSGGTSVSLLSADTDDEKISQFQGLLDGVIEVRETDEGGQYRLRSSIGAGEWQPIEVEGPAVDRSETTSESGSPTEAGDRPSPVTTDSVIETPSSLRAFIESLDAASLTLTVCNLEPDTSISDRVVEYFERHNVSVRTADCSTETSVEAALLHRGADPIAMSTLQDLQAAIDIETASGVEQPTDVKRPDILRHVHRNEFSVEDGSRIELTRISRLIEGRALEAGRGTLHAGFQRLQRIEDDVGTAELYEGITATDVTVHVYGAPGDLPEGVANVIHSADEGEILDSWFVVYDGGGDPARMAALVCEETNPNRYTGVWTYRPPEVQAVAEYLDSTYVEATDDAT